MEHTQMDLDFYLLETVEDNQVVAFNKLLETSNKAFIKVFHYNTIEEIKNVLNSNYIIINQPETFKSKLVYKIYRNKIEKSAFDEKELQYFLRNDKIEDYNTYDILEEEEYLQDELQDFISCRK